MKTMSGAKGGPLYYDQLPPAPPSPAEAKGQGPQTEGLLEKLAFRHIAQKPAEVTHLKTLLGLAVPSVHDPRVRAAIREAIE